VKPSQFLLSDVISKRTTFSQPLTPPSDPPANAPGFFLGYRRYINHLLTYLVITEAGDYAAVVHTATAPHHHTTTTILRPFFRDHPGEPVPQENFWTLWCKGRLTD